MTEPRRAAPALLWVLQWGLAAAFCVIGCLMMGLPVDELHRLGLARGVSAGRVAPAGIFLLVASVALVVPSASTFLPWLSPLAAVVLAAAVSGAPAPFLPPVLGTPLPDLALVAGCGVVALWRGFLFPVRSARERHRHPAVAAR
jgi:hypothetical protein